MNPLEQNRPGRADRCFVVVALFLLSNALLPLFGRKGLDLGGSEVEGNVGVQAMYHAPTRVVRAALRAEQGTAGSRQLDWRYVAR